MIDAFMHLDLSMPDPLADIRTRLGQAALDGAVVVETWDGANRALLEPLLADAADPLHVALCWRAESDPDPRSPVIRVRTSTLAQAPVEQLQERGQWLLIHGDTPIEQWAACLTRVAQDHPALKICVPHLGWPTFESEPNPGWADRMAQIAAHPNAWLVVSAISHFSREPFPHDDVRRLTDNVAARFPPSRVLAGSDYPLCAKTNYAQSIGLVHHWLRSLWPEWNCNHALFT